MACGILLDQGSNLCPLHWQVDSLPLNHQGSPTLIFEVKKTKAEGKVVVLGPEHMGLILCAVICAEQGLNILNE